MAKVIFVKKKKKNVETKHREKIIWGKNMTEAVILGRLSTMRSAVYAVQRENIKLHRRGRKKKT